MQTLNRYGNRQTGVATLLVTMILFISATLLVLYAANTAVGEQRMSANEVRSKQALEAAQAAVDLSIQNINGGGAFTYAPTEASATWTAQNSRLRGRFCANYADAVDQVCSDLHSDGIAPGCTAPDADASGAWLVACGWSDDSAARRRIISFVGKASPLPGNITNPLTARGSVAMGGNPTVVNYYNNLTVWTGNNLSSSSATGKTVLRRPSSPAGVLTPSEVAAQVGGGNQVCNPSQAPDLICTTSSGVVGPDVIQGDPTLSALSDSQFFENFLGMTPTEYKSLMAQEVVAGADAGTISEGGKVYWVDGDATIDQDIGSEAEPVVLVVDGDLNLSGSPTIFGVVFVTGTLNQAGGTTIRGALLASGTVSGSGSLNVIYDPNAIAGGGDLGSFATVPGTWRDF